MRISPSRFVAGPPSGTVLLIAILIALCSFSACGHPPQAAQSPPPPPLQLLSQWGHSGDQPGEFQKPQVITCDGAGSVYIADDGNPPRIEKFDSSGRPLLVFGILSNPNDWDLAIDPGGAIFAVDRRHGWVQIFSPEGKPFRTLFFHYRRDLHDPSSIAMEPEGNFYLADSVSGRIAELNPSGRASQSWSKPAGVDGHWTPYPIRLGADGNIYVGNSAERRVEKLSGDGRYLASWNFAFTALDFSSNSPKTAGLAVSHNLVAASDSAKRLLQIWTLDGQPKLTVDFSQHPEWGAQATPTDIAFSPNGELFVLDAPDLHVLRFKVNIQP